MTNKKQFDITLPGVADEHANVASVVIQGQPVSVSQRAKVDLVFVIDTTGSMSDKIEGVLATCADFLASFGNLKLDHQVGIVAFGDLTVPGDRIVATPFLTNLEGIRRTLMKIPRFSGGGNEGESSFEALHTTMRLPFREAAVKVVVLITDEPALMEKHSAPTITGSLREREIVTYVISPPLQYFKDIASATGGTWLQVTSSADFSSLLQMLKDLASRVSSLVDQVHRLAGGSVKEFLRLHPPRA